MTDPRHCPECSARPGEPCRGPSGAPLTAPWTHAARQGSARPMDRYALSGPLGPLGAPDSPGAAPDSHPGPPEAPTGPRSASWAVTRDAAIRAIEDAIDATSERWTCGAHACSCRVTTTLTADAIIDALTEIGWDA